LPRIESQLPNVSYDVVVVGTGFGGAVAACRLAQAGVEVAVLERGLRFPPGSFPRHLVGRGGLLWDRGEGLYDVRPLNDMLVVQAAGYGGGSLVYANVQMRPPADLFDRGWPSSYSRTQLDPYYDLVAEMLDVTPIRPAPPDAGSPDKTRAIVDASRAIGRTDQTFLPNLAVTFEGSGEPPEPNRFGAPQSGCIHCGECIIGCNVGAKNTLDLNYLAEAERNGAEVATSTEVVGLAPTSDGFRLDYRDPADGEVRRHVDARSVFLCMGAVNTTELLLRCRDQFQTLPGLSSKLGEGYSGNGDFLAFAVGTSEDVMPSRGPTITTARIHDRVIDGERRWFVVEEGGYPSELASLLPFLDPSRLTHLAERELDDHIVPHSARAVRRTAEHLANDDTAVMLLMGRDRADGRIELVGSDRQLHVRWDTSANLPLYAAEAAASGELAAALGGRLRLPVTWRLLGQPVAVHNLGGCPMADDPARGVVDPDGRVFGYPGLHVLDGSILPSATGVNPSHTIAAVAERCIEEAIRRMDGRSSWRVAGIGSPIRRWIPEDRVVIPDGGTRPVRTQRGGLRYREQMHGLVRPVSEDAGARPRRFRFVVDSAAASVRDLVDDPAHPTVLTGRVWVDGLTGAEGAPVIGGTFHLLVQTDDPRERVMTYALPFREPDEGRLLVLRGRKVVRGRRIRDLWRALTRMEATIEPSDGEVSDRGQARIDTVDVVRLVTSIRVVGGDGRWGSIRGILTFERFFVGSVLGVYLAGHRGGRPDVRSAA
jgi:cholesterol oxidase